MAVFAYKGRNTNGDLVEGTLFGESSSAIADQLMATGVTPIEIIPFRGVAGGAEHKAGWRRRWFGKKRVSTLDLMLFSRQMYTLLKAGVPILRALAGLQESTSSPVLAVVIQDLRESLDAGRELSTSMRRHSGVFSPFYVSMVQVGEMTGTLDETFMRLYDHLEFERDMHDRIRAALRYPIFVLIAMAIAIVIINLFVIPAFAKVYEGLHAQLPVVTRMLLAFSSFMVHYWLLMLALIIGAVLGFRFYINTTVGRYQWDKYKLNIPVIGKIVFKATLARFARSLALSFKSGMPILQGMNVVALVVDNEFMRSRIEQMRDGIERGESILRTAVAAGVFNPVVLQMIAVGEETGDLDGLMFEVAGMYEREVKYDVASLSADIEPVLIVVLGILVLILALGVFLPMWDLGKVALRH
ncbi:MAG TPA: type II secretion system F family protein [Gallionella sp.]|nr:type II secretion system F family protein [Gallionella sp.]